ncbi:MAG: hypothetical protein GY950_23400, partial [bacterium]|nr:hypothetical protein [bacterium]
HYAAAPPGIRGRIEELLFTHCRLTDDTSLMGHFAPFKVFQSSQTLSLPQIDRQRETARVFAVPRHKERLRYNTTGKTVLALTREHADFLINQRKLPLTFLPPVRRKEKRLPTLFYSLKKGSKRFLLPFIRLFFKIKGKRVLALDQLTPSEQSFLLNLNRHLGREGALGAVMIAAGGLFPAIPPKRNKPGNRVSQPLLVRRDHSLVRRAISAAETAPDNVEMFIPLLEG